MSRPLCSVRTQKIRSAFKNDVVTFENNFNTVCVLNTIIESLKVLQQALFNDVIETKILKISQDLANI